MELLANIDVDDITVATDFYCRALNLTVGRRFGNSGVELLGASSAIYLLEKPAGSVAQGKVYVPTMTRSPSPMPALNSPSRHILSPDRVHAVSSVTCSCSVW